MFIALVVAFVVASGCTDTRTIPLAGASPIVPTPPLLSAATSASNGAAGAGQGGHGTVYAVDPLVSRIFRFDAGDSGNDVTPQAIIAGGNTQLLSPRQLAVDTVKDKLYVLDLGRVLVFDTPKALNGNVAPTRVLSPTVPGAISIAVDEITDILYLGHNVSLGITSYNNASTINNAITPDRKIAGALTTVTTPRGLVATGNRIIAADSGAQAVISFDSASTVTGNVAPTRSIVGASTGFLTPFALALDLSGMLYLADITAGGLSVYVAGTTATGNVTPDLKLSPAVTGLLNARQLTSHDGTTILAAQAGDGVATAGAILTYLAGDLRKGAGSPIRGIQAPTAGMTFPTGVAHDPGH